MVTFDCGSSGRLGDLEPAAKAARELLVLDHHVSNTRFGTINVVDPGAAASGVLVRRLVLELGLPLTNDAAVALYAALVCDTGRFQYDTTSPSVFRPRRELVTFDVPVSRLSRMPFEEHRFALPQGAGRGPGCRRARRAAPVRLDGRHPGHAPPPRRHDGGDRGLIDIVRRATEADVTCVLKEDVDGSIRVSLRSLGDVDVREIAVVNGGGGHRYAAGFESADPARWCSNASAARSPARSPARSRLSGEGGEGIRVRRPGGGRQACGVDVTRRRREAAPGLRPAQGRPRGHARPDATGVLLVGLGRATRLLRYLQEQGKAYRGG